MKTEGNNNNKQQEHKETPIPPIPWIKIESTVQLSDGLTGMVIELNDQRNNGYRLLMDHNNQLEYHPLNEIIRVMIDQHIPSFDPIRHFSLPSSEEED